MNDIPQPGPPARRYTVIPRTLVFIRSDREILFKKGLPGRSPWPGKYNGVGGHVEQGETVLQAALREVVEETGLDALEQVTLCGVIAIDPERAQQHGIMVFVFTAHTASRAIHTTEEGELRWLDWHTIPSDLLVKDLPDLLSHLETREKGKQASTPLFYAHYTHDAQGRLITEFA